MTPPPATPPPPLDRRDAGILSAIFLTVLLLFWGSPILQMGDSKYTLLLSQSLLTRGSPVLDGYGIPHYTPFKLGQAHLNGEAYPIEIVHDHFYNFFPPGSGVLSAPFVLVGDLLGYSVTPDGHHYEVWHERNLQHFIGSLLMAGLAALFYGMARLLLPWGWSLGLALGAALGTQMWSTASRALWNHTWGIALLGWVFYLLLAQETGRRRLRPVLLGTILSWTYFVRPTNSVFILAVTGYLALFHRRLFLAYAATGAAWFAGFVVYSWTHFHKPLPSYYQANRLETNHFWEAFAGNLVSPSRGVLIFVPVTLFVAYLLARYWRGVAYPRLLGLALVCGAGHLAAVSCFNPWFGGECFGPRYLTEWVPLLVLLAVLGVDAARRRHAASATPDTPPLEWRVALVGGALLLLVSIAINARGANSTAPEQWNEVPDRVDDDPARIWDWRYPQIAAGWLEVPPPPHPPRFEGERMDFTHDAARRYEWTGWSPGEPDFCWTAAARAELTFTRDHPEEARTLRLFFQPFLVDGKVNRQRVLVSLNGRQVADFSVTEPDPREYLCPLPPGVLQGRNLLVFRLPDARSPLSLGSGDDGRTLGIALRWLELNPAPAPVDPPK